MIKNNLLQKINKSIQTRKYLSDHVFIRKVLADEVARQYFLTKFQSERRLLKDAEFILMELIRDKTPFPLVNILESSISPENNSYILSFISKHYEDFGKTLLNNKDDRMFQYSLLRLVHRIVSSDINAYAEETLKFIQNLLKKKSYKKRDVSGYSSGREEEKQYIGRILTAIASNPLYYRNIIKIIDSGFDLIYDHMRLVYDTPGNIFEILKNYIEQAKDISDFKERFKEVVNILINQYKHSSTYTDSKTKESKFSGYEWIGGGISATNYHFSVEDNTFVSHVLRPALDTFYSKYPEEIISFVESYCIYNYNKSKTLKVNADHPDFLLRASVGVLLNEYKNDNKKADSYLKSFIKDKKGIPGKDDLIFQDIEKNSIILSDEKVWNLINSYIVFTDNNPTNAFVIQIISKLASRGHNDAASTLFKVIGRESFYRGIGFMSEGLIVDLIDRLSIESPGKSLEAVKVYLATKHFENENDRFNVYKLSHVLNKLIADGRTQEDMLKLLIDLSKNDELTINQQIILCHSLIAINADEEKETTLIKIYDKLLWPLLSNDLKKDLKKDYENKDYGLIYKKIPYSHAREGIVQFADHLAKKRRIKEALSIISIFKNDPDPFTPLASDPLNPDDKNDEHRRILEEKQEVKAITTVRGWCGWVIFQCSVLSGREYIKDMINYAEELIKDENLFVSGYGADGLSGLARNRLTVLPDDRNTLFFGKDKREALVNAKRVQDIAFYYLKRIASLPEKAQDNLVGSLLSLFNPMRSLNEKDAKIFVDTIVSMSSKVIHKAVPLLLFFAEFRPELYKDWKWQEAGLFDDLDKFDGKYFVSKLVEAMKKDDETRGSFAWQFYHLPEESEPDNKQEDGLKYSESIEISLRYFNLLLDKYEHHTFSMIYMFIEKNIDKRFDELYILWRKCMEKEYKFYMSIKKENKSFDDMFWWPYNNTEKILMSIYQKKGVGQFIKDLKSFLDFPEEVVLMHMESLVPILKEQPKTDKKVGTIFDELIKRNKRNVSFFYDAKNEWLTKKN